MSHRMEYGFWFRCRWDGKALGLCLLVRELFPPRTDSIVQWRHQKRNPEASGQRRRLPMIIHSFYSVIVKERSDHSLRGLRASALSPKIRIFETLPIFKKSGFFLIADILIIHDIRVEQKKSAFLNSAHGQLWDVPQCGHNYSKRNRSRETDSMIEKQRGASSDFLAALNLDLTMDVTFFWAPFPL